MWLLSFLPDSMLHVFVNSVLFVGIAATILGFVFNLHVLGPYKPIVQLVGIICLSLGLYFRGGYEVEQQWRDRVAILEAKVKASESLSKVINTVIETKIVEKIKVVYNTKVITKKVIVKVAAKIDAECIVSPEVIIIHNSAAKNIIPILELLLPTEETK
jgi:hypothetical protein